MTETTRPTRVRCSFCSRDGREVQKMIAGPDNIHICDDCVRLCRNIVNEDDGSLADSGDFSDTRPSTILNYLDEHIIGQSRAKRALSVAVYNHFKRLRDGLAITDDDVELSKGNVLMIGPTGSGKTLMAKTLARRLGVPFTMADATTLTEAGYVGEDVESIVKNLWIAAEKDPERAAQGVVCLDEIDKLARAGSGPNQMRDVGGEGVQQALLKIIEGQIVNVPPEGSRNRPQQEFVQLDTSNVLFICAGSFQGLPEIIERRLHASSIGFGATPRRVPSEREQLLREVRSEDLIRFGLIPEFVGRIPVIVTFDELSETEMVEVLWKPKNALVRQYKRLMELEDVNLRFHQEAMVAIVQEAMRRGSGARGLRSVIENIMLDVMYDIPSIEDVRECVITEECVTGGAQPLIIRKQA